MLNDTFHIGQGDTQDPLRATIYQEDGVTPVDLTGATVTFSMKTDLGAELVAAGVAVVENPPTAGVVRYDWQTGDTDVAGEHVARFKVTVPAGVFSAPNESYITVHVTSF